MAKEEGPRESVGLTLKIAEFEVARFDIADSLPAPTGPTTPASRLDARLSLYGELVQQADVMGRLVKRYHRLPTEDEVRAEMAHLLPPKGK